MATVAAQPQTVPTSSRSSSVVNGASTAGYTNGHGEMAESPASNGPQGPAPVAPSTKKTKAKKATDPNETSKLLAAKISQLESDAAGEKDQEAEIGKSRNMMPSSIYRNVFGHLLPIANNHYLGRFSSSAGLGPCPCICGLCAVAPLPASPSICYLRAPRLGSHG